VRLTLEKLEIHNEQVADKVWRTMHDWHFCIDDLMHTITRHFYHDKYSGPRNPIYKRDRNCEREDMPAVLHDFLMRNRKLLGLSMMQCHDLFRQAMVLAKLPTWLVRLKYSGVVAFNWLIAGPGDGSPPRAIRRVMKQQQKG
jgi:hypothetical protein